MELAMAAVRARNVVKVKTPYVTIDVYVSSALANEGANKEQQNIFGKIWTIYKLLFSRGSTSTLSCVNFLQNLSRNIFFSILCI